MATLAKAKLTDSVGVSSPPEEPDHWIDSTITSVKTYLRKTCLLSAGAGGLAHLDRGLGEVLPGTAGGEQLGG